MHPNWVFDGTPPNTTALISPFGQEHAVQTSVMQFKCDSSILNDTHIHAHLKWLHSTAWSFWITGTFRNLIATTRIYLYGNTLIKPLWSYSELANMKLMCSCLMNKMATCVTWISFTLSFTFIVYNAIGCMCVCVCVGQETFEKKPSTMGGIYLNGKLMS